MVPETGLHCGFESHPNYNSLIGKATFVHLSIIKIKGYESNRNQKQFNYTQSV
jgi:hypothetical protein